MLEQQLTEAENWSEKERPHWLEVDTTKPFTGEAIASKLTEILRQDWH